MRSLVLALSLALLVACSRSGGDVAADAAAPAQMKEAALADAEGAAATPARSAITIPMLAYRYGYELEAPARAIRGLVARHEAACQAAGPQTCQLVGAQVSSAGQDRLQGEVTLRATPDWVKRFRAGLEADAKSAGGRVVGAKVESEDLSRQIVDTEASLRARTTLRDRLQALLASRPGKLSELLEVERELARVQAEIDATQSELAVMRGRVATSELKLVYRSSGVLAPQGVLAPLASAFNDFFSIVVVVLAGLVRLFAYVLPVAILGGLAFWAIRGRLARRPTTPPPPPEA